MKRASRSLRFLQYWHQTKSKEHPDKKIREEHRWLYQLSKDAEKEYDEFMRDAEMQGIRNPAFPDDLVGWLDDDFTLPDDDSYKSSKPKDEDDETP